jgi:transposase
MTAPYLIDFRKKVVAVYKTEKISKTKLAERFKISLSSVKRYLKLDKGTGDLSPKVEGKGRPGKIGESGYKLLKEIIQKQPTITLEELAKIFYKKKKIKAGRSILSRACQKLALRHKQLSRYTAEQEREDVKKKLIGKK